MSKRIYPKGTTRVSLDKKVKKLNWKDYPCWIWPFGINAYGYPVKSIGSRKHAKKEQVHRLLRKLLVGEIPIGFEPDHLCRNPGCINPIHTELVTHKENVRRGLIQTKLTWKEVKEIRRLYGKDNFSYSKVAKHYNVSKTTVWEIVKHKTWHRNYMKEGQKKWRRAE